MRNMKVYDQSGYNYKSTPAIMLKGQWLKDLGFEPGQHINVVCENGQLVITPNAEKAKEVEAEKAFMEKETKKLHALFMKEKRNFRNSLLQNRKRDMENDVCKNHYDRGSADDDW